MSPPPVKWISEYISIVKLFPFWPEIVPKLFNYTVSLSTFNELEESPTKLLIWFIAQIRRVAGQSPVLVLHYTEIDYYKPHVRVSI